MRDSLSNDSFASIFLFWKNTGSKHVLSITLSGTILFGYAQSTEKVAASINFEKHQIASESYETVGIFDVNNDNIPDIISGAFWYEGPEFLKRHYIGPTQRYGEYWDEFSTIPLDVNKDGFMDIVTGGWFGKQLRWLENPGNDKEWISHIIAEPGNIETTCSWDIDGDGVAEIIPNTPNNDLVIYRLDPDHIGNFITFKVTEKHGHGLGFGDINGDGRGDLVVHNGWLEAPELPFSGEWVFHNEFELGTAGIPIIIHDINGDGKTDFIVGQGHGYGLDWYEQKWNKREKATNWIKHAIDPYNSQYHTMAMADLDGDGQSELITGKRYRAHNGKDPGSNDPLGLYYFRWNGESFSKQVISYGPYGEGKGAGLGFSVYDLSNSGRPDIIVAGKDGLCVFQNKGPNP